jgi:IS30 family transposase
MSKTLKGNQKHLTLSDRSYIEQALLHGLSFRKMATVLHKDPSTISKEIRLHKRAVRENNSNRNDCLLSAKCQEHHICGNKICMRSCWVCKTKDCHDFCNNYIRFSCDRLTKPPYVCNGCPSQSSCKQQHLYYHANVANAKYHQTLVSSRSGINCTPEKLEMLDCLVSPLIKKGQPLSHIYAAHTDEIPCCRRTLYNYMDRSLLAARNIDLPRRVRYKRRKHRKEGFRDVNQTYRNRRSYKDFERFMEAHPDAEIIEMDTVKGSRDAGKVLLTLLFRNSSFMLIFLLPRGTQACVADVFNMLSNVLGINIFRKTFPVILTDNGPEFKDPSTIEKSPDGRRRTYVFYCDPYVSNQKARIEKNHEFIRYVLPKGKGFRQFCQDDITLMTNHINSIARDNLNRTTPFDLASLLIDKKVLVSLGLKKVSPDEVLLKPALLKK